MAVVMSMDSPNGQAGTARSVVPKRQRPVSPWVVDLLTVGAPLVLLYSWTASRDLGTVDSGELAVVCARMGIAHPPGYPLYTLLGRLACMFPSVRPILALNLLSAVIAAAAAWMAAGLARELLVGDRGNRPEPRAAMTPWFARSAGFWLGTSSVAWNQATGNEVYGLHLLFTVLILRLSLLVMRRGGWRDLALLGWVVGLSFAHHLSTAFLLPAAGAAVFMFVSGPRGEAQAPLRGEAPVPPRGAAHLVPGGAWRGRARLLAFASLCALLAWSVVLVLPLRSTADPVLDWGDPAGWARLWRHLTGNQYSVWMFESWSRWGRHLGGYVASLPERFSWPALLVVIPGLVALLRQDRRALLLLTLAFAVTVGWASSYDIHDLAPYYLPADLVLALLAAAGLGALERMQTPLRHFGRPLLMAIAGGMIAYQVAIHFRDADRRSDHFVRFHAETILHELPPRTVLLSHLWDATVSPLLYLQEVEHQRTDVTVVDTELLRRSWYFPQLARRDPELLRPFPADVQTFLQRVAPFESKRPFDPAAIEASYRTVIHRIAQTHRPARPTAYTPEVEPGFADAAVGVPEGLVSVLRDGPGEAAPLDPPDVAGLLRAGYRPTDDVHRLVVQQWAQMIQARLRFLQAMGRTQELPSWEAAWQLLRPVAEDARRREAVASRGGS
jgi:hypothetical protein